MRAHSLRHLDDVTLVGELRALVVRERESLAAMLAHLAEVERRKLYAPAGYSSMHDYCVKVLGWSRQTAFKRIGAARAARKFPEIFGAIADGRLHVSAVVMLRTQLNRGNAAELLAAAANRSKSEIEALLAGRAPKADVPTRITPLGQAGSKTEESRSNELQLSPGIVERALITTGTSDLAPSQVAPKSVTRFALQVTIDDETLALLQRARDLLSHQNPSRDVAVVLRRALEELVQRLEKRKYSATDTPRPGRVAIKPGNRCIPAEVRRAVRDRDGDRCTFVAEDGTRCGARARLEFDHVVEFARGGEATVENLRLRCRTHNQLAAERTFGSAFMQSKRTAARRAAAEARRKQVAEAKAEAMTAEQDPERSVVPWLRRLGFRLDEARRAAARCEHLGDVPMAERVRAALAYSAPATAHGSVREAGSDYGLALVI